MAALRRLGGGCAISLLRHPGRFFASASAAAYIDYESEWDEHNEMAEACGARVERGVQWVFMGSPGIQKHVYASRISQLLGVPYISMGSLVRRELNPRSSLYKQIANAVNEGKLVPEDVIFALLSKRLEECHYNGETGFILDGIPRTRYQAEILDLMADIDLVVNFKYREECLVNKQLRCDVSSHFKRPYQLNNSESTATNPCLASRSYHDELNCSSIQDKQEIQDEKFKFYKEQNRLLEDYYRKQMKLVNFQVANGPRETWQELLTALHLHQAGTTICSSRSLTS